MSENLRANLTPIMLAVLTSVIAWMATVLIQLKEDVATIKTTQTVQTAADARVNTLQRDAMLAEIAGLRADVLHCQQAAGLRKAR